MALIHCPECKAEISDTAKSCPKCGFDRLKILSGQTTSAGSFYLKSETAHGVQYYVLGLLDFCLALVILLVCMFGFTGLSTNFNQIGQNLPGLSEIFLRVGYFASDYWVVWVIGMGGLAGFYFFHLKVKKKVQVKYLVIAFCGLLLLLIVLVIDYFYTVGLLSKYVDALSGH